MENIQNLKNCTWVGQVKDVKQYFDEYRKILDCPNKPIDNSVSI